MNALPVMEHFFTLQGEGHYTGAPAYFIRLGGCDIGCHWCDVKESWDAGDHPKMTIDTLVSQLPDEAKIVVLTGGEPLMWDLKSLTRQLHANQKRIHIETSGAYPLNGEIDWVCISPKKNRLPLDASLQQADELKCIIYNRHDFLFAEEMAQKVPAHTLCYLQPEWSKKDTMLPEIIHYIKTHPKWRLSLQTHKYINIP